MKNIGRTSGEVFGRITGRDFRIILTGTDESAGAGYQIYVLGSKRVIAGATSSWDQNPRIRNSKLVLF